MSTGWPLREWGSIYCGTQEGFDDLLRRPLGGRVSSDIEVDDLAAFMLDNKEHVEDSKGHRGHGEEIDRSDVPDVFLEKRPPGLRRRLAATNHVLGHRRLGDVDAQHLQLAVNSRCTPAKVIARHAPNELTDFLRNRRTTAPSTARLPSPIKPKALAVPPHQSIGLEDMQCL